MPVEITPGYQRWRDHIFTVQPEHVNLAQPAPNGIYGVLVDIGMFDPREAVQWAISISAFSSGEASFQPTPGGGIIGLGADVRVAETAREIVAIAQPLLPHTQSAYDRNLPQPETVQFFFFIPSGIRVLRGSLDDCQQPHHPCQPLLEKFRFIHYLAHQLASYQARPASAPTSAPAPISVPNPVPAAAPAPPSVKAAPETTPETTPTVPATVPEATQLQLDLNTPVAAAAPVTLVNPMRKWLHVLVFWVAAASYLFLVISLFNVSMLRDYFSSIQAVDTFLQQGDYSSGVWLRYQGLRVGAALVPPLLVALPNLWQIVVAILSDHQNPSIQTFSKQSALHLVADGLIIASLSWFFVWMLWAEMPNPDRLEAILGNAKYYWLAAIACSAAITISSDRLAALRNVVAIYTIIDQFNFIQTRDATLSPFLECSVKAYKEGPLPTITNTQKKYIREHGVRPTGLVLAVDKTEKFDFRYWRNRVSITPERPPLRDLDHQHFARITLSHRLKAMDDETVQYIQETWVEFTNKYLQYRPHVNFSKQTDCEYDRQNKTVIAVLNPEHLPKIIDPDLRFLLGFTPFGLAYSLWLDSMTLIYEIEVITEYSHYSPLEPLRNV